jgi:hypothetical protein
MNTDMNFEDEIAKMKASMLSPEITSEQDAANIAYLNSLDYSKKPDNVSDSEWKDILEYRNTGKIPKTEYEELDFNNVGGTEPSNNLENE